MAQDLNTSWLSGKYEDVNAEINVSYSTVAIGDYFWQGAEADAVISDIHDIWVNGNITVPEAITQFSENMGLEL